MFLQRLALTLKKNIELQNCGFKLSFKEQFKDPYSLNETIYIIRLEKHLQCEKLLGLARGTTKKCGNKKSDESITPIRYNVNHMYQ